MRSIQAVQRIGQDLPETVLQFDQESHLLSLGPAKSEAEAQTLSEAILEYLKGAEDPKTEPEIGDSVEGKTLLKRKALRLLVEARKVGREGSGRRGDPFRYRFSFSCSPDIVGTREQETEKGPETSINTGDILVPDSPSNSILVPASRKQEETFEEGEL